MFPLTRVVRNQMGTKLHLSIHIIYCEVLWSMTAVCEAWAKASLFFYAKASRFTLLAKHSRAETNSVLPSQSGIHICSVKWHLPYVCMWLCNTAAAWQGPGKKVYRNHTGLVTENHKAAILQNSCSARSTGSVWELARRKSFLTGVGYTRRGFYV